MTKAVACYAALSAEESLAPFSIDRREPEAEDVAIDIIYCGVCHTDLHQVHNDWNNTLYPCVPGHEIVGRVADVGSSISRFKAGDLVAVGCLVDSCRECHSCKVGASERRVSSRRSGWATRRASGRSKCGGPPPANGTSTGTSRRIACTESVKALRPRSRWSSRRSTWAPSPAGRPADAHGASGNCTRRGTCLPTATGAAWWRGPSYLNGSVLMLETIIILLIVLWLLGFIAGTLGNLIHILLVVAIIVVLFRVIRGRRPI